MTGVIKVRSFGTKNFRLEAVPANPRLSALDYFFIIRLDDGAYTPFFTDTDSYKTLKYVYQANQTHFDSVVSNSFVFNPCDDV